MNNQIKIGGMYQHFKGMKVCVLGLAKDSETMDDVVVYINWPTERYGCGPRKCGLTRLSARA
jgi:hypothetical protein